MDDRHAPRRTPATPDAPLSLEQAGRELLETARQQNAGRAARALLPGAGAALTQTLVALTPKAELDQHITNGPATLHVLDGDVELRWDDGALRLTSGEWAPISTEQHSVHAATDSICLITVAPAGADRT